MNYEHFSQDKKNIGWKIEAYRKDDGYIVGMEYRASICWSGRYDQFSTHSRAEFERWLREMFPEFRADAILQELPQELVFWREDCAVCPQILREALPGETAEQASAALGRKVVAHRFGYSKGRNT